jgi:3'(2'), 5'-bisphosphate nucleotidase
MSSSTKPFALEHTIALLAVQRAAILTKRVYVASEAAKGTTKKEDHSPVTVGDYGAQALIISALKHVFPADDIIAEEDADDLQTNEGLRDAIWGYVKETSLESAEDEKLGGKVKSVEDMIKAIDGGRAAGGRKGRVWTLDPIDGTKGFLRGGQYAIALALVVDGQVAVGVHGCPNLPVDDSARLDTAIGHDQSGTDSGRGVLISAIKGQGSFSRALTTGALADAHKIHMRPLTNVSDAVFCESVEAAHSSHSEQHAITVALGITSEPVRMDSQAKYASLARGAGDIYLRLPTNKAYKNKIWDHAAGDLMVWEAGGKCTDAKGDIIDFGTGRELQNIGFVCAAENIHGKVIEAVKQVLSDSGKL